MARDRAVTTPEWQALSLQLSAVRIESTLPRTFGSASLAGSSPSITFIPAQDPTRSRPSLDFLPISRTLVHPDYSIRVGRYSEREHNIDTSGASDCSNSPIGFKSKVVSRKHCEFFYNTSQWYIKDVKSSSGTFLNHVRLSPPGIESRPYPISDGDIVQLGIDFKGGEETMFRCVKMRIETNRSWQKGLNKFNKSTHQQLQQLAKQTRRELDRSSKHSTECTICLNPIAPCQALFVAPCSHTWHYKCIKTVLDDPKYPHFLCPNCRAQADLSADVDDRELQDFEEFQDEGGEQAMSTNSDHVLLESQRNGNGSMLEPQLHNEGARSSQDASMMGTDTSEPSSTFILPLSEVGRRQSTERAYSVHQENNPSSLESSHSLDEARRGGEFSRQLNTAPAEASIHIAVPTPESYPQTSRSHAVTMDSIENTGPLTPRNAAGPFILNGSA